MVKKAMDRQEAFSELQASYAENKIASEMSYLAALGFCLAWFVGIICVLAFYDTIIRILTQ